MKWPQSAIATDNRIGIYTESSLKCWHDFGVVEICIIMTLFMEKYMAQWEEQVVESTHSEMG